METRLDRFNFLARQTKVSKEAVLMYCDYSEILRLTKLGIKKETTNKEFISLVEISWSFGLKPD